MNHQQIEEHNVADRYLMAKLSDAERIEFEEHFIDCPACIDLLETTDRLRRGLRAKAVEQSATVVRLGLLGWFVRRSSGWRAALVVAGVVALVLPTALMVFVFRQLRTEQSASAEWEVRARDTERSLESTRTELQQAQRALTELQTAGASPHVPGGGAFASVFMLNRLRSSDPGEVNQVIISVASQWIVLSPELDLDAGAGSYRATLTKNGQMIWQQDQLKLNAKGTIEPILNSGLFSTGRYLLTVEVLRGGRYSVVGRYPFQVVAK